MKSWLRAGLLGGAGIVSLTLILTLFEIPSHIPAYLDWIIIYPAVGALSTVWSSTSPSLKEGAGMAALSGLVVGGINLLHTLLISISIMWGSDFYINYYPHNMILFLRDNMASQFFSALNLPLLIGIMVASLILATSTGALGGWIYVLWKGKGNISTQRAA